MVETRRANVDDDKGDSSSECAKVVAMRMDKHEDAVLATVD